jgi:hypothetical protein
MVERLVVAQEVADSSSVDHPTVVESVRVRAVSMDCKRHDRAGGAGKERRMANFKRGRPKNARSGCLLCKRHKSNAQKGRLEAQTWQERRARLSEREQICEVKPR